MLEADLRPASGSELGWAANAVGAARAQQSRAPGRGDAENGGARRAWVENDGVPSVRLGGQLTAKEGEWAPTRWPLAAANLACRREDSSLK